MQRGQRRGGSVPAGRFSPLPPALGARAPLERSEHFSPYTSISEIGQNVFQLILVSRKAKLHAYGSIMIK